MRTSHAGAHVERLEPRRLLSSLLPGFAETPVTGNVLQGTTFEIAPDGTLFVVAGAETGTGVVLAHDLNDNAMVVDDSGSSPLATVQSLLTGGSNNGAWTGNGIRSSLADASEFAVGFAESSEIFTSFPATFAGQDVDDTAVLVKYALYGDADLDSDVDSDDFNRLATNFGQSSRR